MSTRVNNISISKVFCFICGHIIYAQLSYVDGIALHQLTHDKPYKASTAAQVNVYDSMDKNYTKMYVTVCRDCKAYTPNVASSLYMINKIVNGKKVVEIIGKIYCKKCREIVDYSSEGCINCSKCVCGNRPQQCTCTTKDPAIHSIIIKNSKTNLPYLLLLLNKYIIDREVLDRITIYMQART
jgi:hypothetical protein